MNKQIKSIKSNHMLLAAGITFFGSVMFSSKAVLVKLAYQYEVTSAELLALRMGFALPFYAFFAFRERRKSKESGKRIARLDWLKIILLGIAGSYVASLLDFWGLQYISASFERLILFTYPTIVVLIGWILFGERLNKAQAVALLLTYSGIILAFVENLGGQQPNFLLGASLVFACAFVYASYLVGSGRLLPRIGTMRYTSIAMLSAAMAIFVHNGIQNGFDLFGFDQGVYFYAFLMAVLATVIPSFMISEGIRVIGSSNAGIIGSIGPISTIVLAYIFLNERLGLLQWLGTLLVIIGVLYISLSKSKKKREPISPPTVQSYDQAENPAARQ